MFCPDFYCRLSHISLSYAVPASGSFSDAYGVEQCQCPPEYAGLSCQVGHNALWHKK